MFTICIAQTFCDKKTKETNEQVHLESELMAKITQYNTVFGFCMKSMNDSLL